MVKLDDLDDVVMLDKAIKNEYSSKIKRYIESLIRHEELSKITNKKRYKDSKRLIYEADFSPLTCEKNIIRQILKEKADLFIKDMEEITMLEKMCSELPTIQEIRGLSTIDRVHIELLAHVIFKYVTLDEDVFDSSKGGIDIHFDIFTQQDVKKLKNTIKAILYNLIGSEGEFFYGIKFRKSNLSDIDILNFRLKLFKHDDIENQRIAFTDYSAVCLYNSDSEYVIYNKFVTEQTKIQIAMEDLVIRSNIFKCMNKSHDIKNVSALINILDEDSNIQSKNVAAGYCSECNKYFIMESTYQSLKNVGIILCRISDEKTYIQTKYFHGVKLASESLLMQYGYNVSETNGLSENRRHIILANMIENNILSKNEIISYLDFFIRQRHTMENMKSAILKWEKDRKFVEDYEVGNIKQIVVKSIYRNNS